MTAKYTLGFETGLHWEEDYIPGGPHRMTTCTNGLCGHPRWQGQPCQICAQNTQEYKDWHDGFAAGKFFQPKTE